MLRIGLLATQYMIGRPRLRRPRRRSVAPRSARPWPQATRSRGPGGRCVWAVSHGPAKDAPHCGRRSRAPPAASLPTDARQAIRSRAHPLPNSTPFCQTLNERVPRLDHARGATTRLAHEDPPPGAGVDAPTSTTRVCHARLRRRRFHRFGIGAAADACGLWSRSEPVLLDVHSARCQGHWVRWRVSGLLRGAAGSGRGPAGTRAPGALDPERGHASRPARRRYTADEHTKYSASRLANVRLPPAPACVHHHSPAATPGVFHTCACTPVPTLSHREDDAPLARGWPVRSRRCIIAGPCAPSSPTGSRSCS